MAADQQWEFCQLILGGNIQQPGGQWATHMAIRYFGSQGRFVVLSTPDRTYHYNPWEYAFGFMGWAGWELVTVQHGTGMSRGVGVTSGASMGGTLGALKSDDVVAYFKRPMQEGRAVDQPTLSLT